MSESFMMSANSNIKGEYCTRDKGTTVYMLFSYLFTD